MGAGRPAYKPTEKHLQCAYNGARKGFNYEEIAKAIGISYITLYRHLDYNVDINGNVEEFNQDEKLDTFRKVIKKGRDGADDLNIVDVENSILKSVKGFEYEEVHTTEKYVQDPSGNIIGMKEVTVKTVKKLVPTSPVLAMFWAVNRGKGRWKSINTKEDRGSIPADKLENAMKAMTEIMDMSHKDGKRPDDNK